MYTIGGPFAQARGFYQRSDIGAVWREAHKFAGPDGHLATLPEVIQARIESKPGDLPWRIGVTTLSAEYVGMSKQGTLLLIVAHGVGPLTTLEGIVEAYGWACSDRDRKVQGGQISRKEFLALEEGRYGEVTLVDLSEKGGYPFTRTLTPSAARDDQVLRARLGSQTEEYLEVQTEATREWCLGQPYLNLGLSFTLSEDPGKEWSFAQYVREHVLRDGAPGSDPPILRLDGASSYCMEMFQTPQPSPLAEGRAYAHLLVIGRVGLPHLVTGESALTELRCFYRKNPACFVGVRAGGAVRFGFGSRIRC